MATNGPADVQATIGFLTNRGGAVTWSPERIDGSRFVALQTTRNLYVGTRWLQAALEDEAAVHANIQHEVGGHLFYGYGLACRIVEHAVVDGDDVDRAALYWDLAYPESEIYAELKELPHASASSLGDEPVADIADQVAHIRDVFPSEVADMLLDSMAHRFSLDQTLTPAAVELFTMTIDGQASAND